MDMESEYARFMSELDATAPAESPAQPATLSAQPVTAAPQRAATSPPAGAAQRPAGTPPSLAQAQPPPAQSVQAARPLGQPPSIGQQQYAQAPGALPGPPVGAAPPHHVARPAGAPPALHPGMHPGGFPGHPPFAQPQHYGGYGPPPYGAQAQAPPQSSAAAAPGGFDPLNIDAEALRKEILGEKKPGTKKAKKPKDGQLRFAGGEAWIDDKMDFWPEGDFRIFVGNLGPEVNDDALEKAFAAYPSFTKGRVIKDYKKCKTKSFGFVSFKDHTDGAKALRAMHGKYIGNRPCQLKKSTHTVRNAPEDTGKRKAMQNNPMERVTTKRMR